MNFSKGFEVLDQAIAMLPKVKQAMVLDIGAGRGSAAKQCADKGMAVDALDPQQREQFMRNPENNHENIHFTVTGIEDYHINKNYDLILLLNVIPFLDKAYVLENLLPSLKSYLNMGGAISFYSRYFVFKK